MLFVVCVCQSGQAFVTMYHKEDIWQCHFDGTSGSTWDISPPNIERLNDEFTSDRDVRIFVTVDFTRFVILCFALIAFSALMLPVCRQGDQLAYKITTTAPRHSIFTSWMLYLTPNQQCQSTEGSYFVMWVIYLSLITIDFHGMVGCFASANVYCSFSHICNCVVL